MKRLLFTTILVGALLCTGPTSAGAAGETFFDQGCDAFDLVEDLGSFFTPLGQQGRWLMRNLRTDAELVFAFDGINLVPPTELEGTTFVAWHFEGTGVRGTNRSDFTITIVDDELNVIAFFQGETFRGTRYKSGGISGTAAGNLGTGEFAYDAVRIVLCKRGFGGGG